MFMNFMEENVWSYGRGIVTYVAGYGTPFTVETKVSTASAKNKEPTVDLLISFHSCK